MRDAADPARLLSDPALAAPVRALLQRSAVVRRLLIDEQAVPADAIGVVDAALLERAGFVRVGRAGVHGLVGVTELGDHLVVSDRRDLARPDVVAGVHPPSRLLADLTVRSPARRALDVGTGNGVQALLLAQHTDHVVATDVSARALAFARATLLLNGVDDVELREGSLLAPVQGETFDVVAANPPYVIGPDEGVLFRSSAYDDDGLCAALCRALPDVLAPGGVATVLVSWVGDDPRTPLGWFDGRGVDALVLHARTDDVATNTATWTRDTVGTPEHAARVARWHSYFEERGIAAVSYGIAVLRKPDPPRDVASIPIPIGLETAASAGEQIGRALDALDGLARAADPLALEVELDAGTVVTTAVRAAPGGWFPVAAGLHSDVDLPMRIALDADELAVVQALGSGAPTMRAAVVRAGVADACGARLLVELAARGHLALAEPS